MGPCNSPGMWNGSDTLPDPFILSKDLGDFMNTLTKEEFAFFMELTNTIRHRWEYGKGKTRDEVLYELKAIYEQALEYTK